MVTLNMKSNKIGIMVVENILQELSPLKLIPRLSKELKYRLMTDPNVQNAAMYSNIPGSVDAAIASNLIGNKKSRQLVLTGVRKALQPKTYRMSKKTKDTITHPSKWLSKATKDKIAHPSKWLKNET